MRARWMDPATGRFLSEDPAGQGANWLIYCSDDPVNRADLNGREFSLVGQLVAGGIAGVCSGFANAFVACLQRAVGLKADGAAAFWSGFVGGFVSGFCDCPLGSAVGSALSAGIDGKASGDDWNNTLAEALIAGALSFAGSAGPGGKAAVHTSLHELEMVLLCFDSGLVVEAGAAANRSLK